MNHENRIWVEIDYENMESNEVAYRKMDQEAVDNCKKELMNFSFYCFT